MVYTLTLNPALDYVIKTDGLLYDGVNRSKGETLRFGGKGINVSVVLTRLGVENTALGFTAGFTGEELERQLKAKGIKNDFIRLSSGNTRINVKLEGDAALEINARGPAVSDGDIAALEEKLKCCKAGDWLILAGSVPDTLPGDIYERLITRLDGRVKVVVDASGELLLSVLKYCPFLIKPNHHELGECFGDGAADTDETVELYAKMLQERGARNVLVSRAEKGALLLSESGTVYKTGNAKGTLVNGVGCGDSMVAGFLAGYLKSEDCADALVLGTACGNATAYAGALSTKAEVDRLAEEVKSLLEIGEL